MNNNLEIWKVVGDQGAFYTLEKEFQKDEERESKSLDIMKLDVVSELKKEDRVAVDCSHFFRTVIMKISQFATLEDVKAMRAHC